MMLKYKEEEKITLIPGVTVVELARGVNARRLVECSMLMAVRKGSLQRR